MARGLAYALAGGLAGYGQGMAQTGMLELQQRRDMALENLRAQNRQAEQVQQYDLMDRNDARNTSRRTDSNIILAREEADITKDRDYRKHGFDKELKQIDFSNDVALKRVASQLGLSQDAIMRQRDAGQINRIVEDGAGKYSIIYNDGSTRQTDVSAPVDAGPGAGSALDRARGGRAQPAPAPKGNPAPAPQRPKETSTKSYTQTEAAATAKQYGVSVDEVHRQLRQAGYKLTN